MLNETIAALKAGGGEAVEEAWSPLITLGTPVTIPEHYVEDLDLRLQLYRRLATLDDEAEIESFAAEMIDRFGPMPDEVKQLMVLVGVKALCRRAHVEKVEAGPKGIIVGFRNNSFANPAGLVRFIARAGLGGQGAARHEDRLHRRFYPGQGPPERGAEDFARAGGDRGEEGRVKAPIRLGRELPQKCRPHRPRWAPRQNKAPEMVA